MQRVRNITQAYKYIKQQDNETALTESAFRRIVKCGYIPTFCIGNKILLKLDDVDRFLDDVTDITVKEVDKGIRKQRGWKQWKKEKVLYFTKVFEMP